jgi:AP endonuclease-2
VISFCDLPKEQQIGGYPTSEQLSRLAGESDEIDPEDEQDDSNTRPEGRIDASTLDSEGRCVILEFPAFVLIGVYCPAYRDESRDTFRMDFLNALDSRVRNLTAMGKRVIVTGDINIAKQGIDAAHGMEAIRKGTTSEAEFISSPSRRLFNHLLSDGVVIGERDSGREDPVLFDICRSFHPDRTGMYTCWDQKLNTRPGNYGSRIDYVLCSLEMQDWLSGSNIQEGLMVRFCSLSGMGLIADDRSIANQGSDHCPVFADFKDFIPQPQGLVHIKDILNPPGMFKNGERQQEYSIQFALPASGRLLPEFDMSKRRSIKDMFVRKPASVPSKLLQSDVATTTESQAPAPESPIMTTTAQSSDAIQSSSAPLKADSQLPRTASRKRSQPLPTPLAKRSKSSAAASPGAPTAGQKSLMGFFKPKAVNGDDSTRSGTSVNVKSPSLSQEYQKAPDCESKLSEAYPHDSSTQSPKLCKPMDGDTVIDPIVSKEDWSKLFTKKPVPPCEGHQEPCISLTTKKPGMNRGRSFWICPRPLGPSGEKEKGTQWRCPTFVWASDWNPSSTTQEQ